MVEYHADPLLPGGCRPFPVEYKRGRAKHRIADEVQLCAQGLCLEEMHGIAVPRGALYYGESHRRVAVELDESLRARTVAAAHRLRVLIETRTVPLAEPGPKCRSCSVGARLPPERHEQANEGEHLPRRADQAAGREGTNVHLNTLYVTTEGSYLGKDHQHGGCAGGEREESANPAVAPLRGVLLRARRGLPGF